MDNPNGNTLGLADDKLKLNKICDNLTCSICLEIIHKCVRCILMLSKNNAYFQFIVISNYFKSDSN